MESSEVFEATGLAVPSPNGQYIASLTPTHLYVQYAHSLITAFTFSLTTKATSSHAVTATTTTARSTASHTPSIRWSHTSHHILLLTPPGVAVFSLSDTHRRVHISNGSAGLGRIVSADMIGLQQGGEQVLVVWEFGRIGVWDLRTGRAAEEIGEVKVGSGKLGDCWSIRREENKAEVLAILGRSGAQDTLSLFLPPSTVPFKTITLSTLDAQCLSWSNNWLSILDSPLATPGAPSLYIYTPDGHLFRTYTDSSLPPAPIVPNTGVGSAEATTEDELASMGPKAHIWSTRSLALASSTDSATTLLSSRTFTPIGLVDPEITPPEFCHQEVLASTQNRDIAGLAGRTYNLLASNSIPLPAGGNWGPVLESKFSLNGKYIAVRYSGLPSAVLVWQVPTAAAQSSVLKAGLNSQIKAEVPTMMLQFSTVKKMVWHEARESLLMLLSEDAGLASTSSAPSSTTTTTGSSGAGTYLFDAAIDQPPIFIPHHFTSLSGPDTGRTEVRFIVSKHLSPPRPTSVISTISQSAHGQKDKRARQEEKLKILVSSRKKGWFLIYPEGRQNQDSEEDTPTSTQPSSPEKKLQTPKKKPTKQHQSTPAQLGAEEDDEVGDESQDSLYDILTGRTPLPELGSGRIRYFDDNEIDMGEDEMDEVNQRLDALGVDEDEEDMGNANIGAAGEMTALGDQLDELTMGLTATQRGEERLSDTFRAKQKQDPFPARWHGEDFDILNEREGEAGGAARGKISTRSWEDEMF